MAKKAPATGKRRHVDVDLTVTDDEAQHDGSHSSKAQRRSKYDAPSNSRTTSALPTPPSSYRSDSRVLNDQQHSEAERQNWLADDDADVNELVASSQLAADGSDQWQHYGDLPTKIVGVSYYKGHANPNEHVLLRREPGNPYDGNAIRVDNVSATQIGHIPRQSAAKLAKYIDNGWLTLVATLAGRIGTYDCPLTVQMFGPDPTTDAGQDLMERMSADKLSVKAVKVAERERLKVARRQAASGSSKYKSRPTAECDAANPMMEDILESSERFDVRNVARDTEAYGVKETDLEGMPMAVKPEEIKTEMLPYQLQALQWLIDHENPEISAPGPENSVQLWSRETGGKKLYTNLATNHSTQVCPKLASGGVLADDMGLGKTLEMIALMVADTKNAARGPTLVVAPLSVMSNWSGQISHHIHKEHALKVYTYHGAGRVEMSASDFGEYDVVITTYQTLAIDYMPRGKGKEKPQSGLRKNGLYGLEWRRIILDEGHIVRNPQSKGAAAVTAVAAKSRWVLTGTPIINSLKDLYSLLRFVGVTGGLETLEVFNSVLVRPLKAGDESGVFLLKAIMKAFTLRRRKDMQFIDLRLPALHEFVQRIDFAPNERKRYDALAAEAKGMLEAYGERKGASSKTGNTYHHLLEILLRMRQCCNHWQLCSERVTSLLTQLESQKTVDLSAENVKALQDVLQVQIESQEDCAICLETLHDPVITNCGHFFGRSCIGQVIERQHKCPMCRAELKDEFCLVSPKHDCGDEDVETNQDEMEGTSTKLEAIVKILTASKSGGTKTIIFSQWTSFLNLIEAKLLSENYKFCRLDGTMSATERDRALGALEDDPATTVMLASLGVCAVGLNLTAANQIILSDTWWAPAIEDQAVDRVHRLGQKKETRVFRLVINDSIEEKTLDIQKNKRALMNLAFSEKGGKRDNQRPSRLADIEQLLA